MQRREFATALALLLAAPTAWAQPATQRVALFDLAAAPAEMTEDGHPYWGALIRELRALGYVEGETIIFDRRSGRGQAEEALITDVRTIVDTRPELVVVRGRRSM